MDMEVSLGNVLYERAPRVYRLDDETTDRKHQNI
jgi:hypothetical protein